MLIESIEEIPGQSNPSDEPNQLPEITKEKFNLSIISADQLAKLEIEPRKPIIGRWFLEGDLGFIYGPRGLGKTWLGVTMARHIAEGKELSHWPVNKSRVLYVDGEMPLEAIQKRDAGLKQSETPDLLFLNHETFFDAVDRPISLSDPVQQKLLADYCQENDIQVLFLDNLSCLFSGMRENDADDWEQVLPWLLSFRRKKIAVVIVHHTGRAGTHMRGTSRREDAAAWTIGLSQSIKGREERKDGARFITRFTKDRNSVTGDETGPLDWHFQELSDGSIRIGVERADNMTIVLQLIKDGLDSNTDIVQETGLTKGAVSKIAKKLEGRKEITIERGKYQIR